MNWHGSRFYAAIVSILLLSCMAEAGFAQTANTSDSKVQSTEIPQVQATQVEIKELKASLAVDVLASRSRVFKTKQKITRVAVSDPSCADVVLMTENQFVVIGKNPGAITVTIWCEPDR